MDDNRDHIIGSKSETPPLCHNKKRLCIISVVAVIAVCMFLWFAGIFQSTFAKHLPEGLRGFVDEDPFDGEVYQWNDAYVSGTGLSLTIVDALEEKYHTYFEISVNDWNMGNPDVLNLRTSTTFPDSDCNDPSAGTIKVCNGDYGDTGWKGQNSVLLRDNKIYASVSLMNDYYLDRSTPEDRLHIMCHELGHGFGLPHTDEWFWNFDQGNCMDVSGCDVLFFALRLLCFAWLCFVFCFSFKFRRSLYSELLASCALPSILAVQEIISNQVRCPLIGSIKSTVDLRVRRSRLEHPSLH